jgi:hypothetical protein
MLAPLSYWNTASPYRDKSKSQAVWGKWALRPKPEQRWPRATPAPRTRGAGGGNQAQCTAGVPTQRVISREPPLARRADAMLGPLSPTIKLSPVRDGSSWTGCHRTPGPGLPSQVRPHDRPHSTLTPAQMDSFWSTGGDTTGRLVDLGSGFPTIHQGEAC